MIIEILFILTWGIGDIFSTWVFLKNGKKEGNPIVKYCLNKFGFISLIIIKIVAISIILYLPFDNYNEKIFFLSVGTVFGIIVTISNLRGEEIILKNLYRKYCGNYNIISDAVN